MSVAQEIVVEVTRCNIRDTEGGKVLQNEVKTLRLSEF